jgi:FKBP-type peptidyl-prolyl cis-trans isomerase (trigger factor)
MEIKVTTQDDGTISIATSATPEQTQAAKLTALEKFAPHINIAGFRPGKAPANLIEQNVRVEKLVEETLSAVSSEIYEKAIEQHKLKTISEPSVAFPDVKDKEQPSYEILAPMLGKEPIQIEITTFTNPKIELGDWEKVVKESKPTNKIETATTVEKASTVKEAKQKAKDEKSPQPNEEEVQPKTPAELEQDFSEQIVDALVKSTKFDLPKALINGEMEYLLARQIRSIEQLGISYGDYLKSQNKKPEELADELAVQAERSLRTRFILTKIAEEKTLNEKATFNDVLDHLKKIAKGESAKEASEDSFQN